MAEPSSTTCRLLDGSLVTLALADSGPAVLPQGGLSGPNTHTLPRWPQGKVPKILVPEAGSHLPWFAWVLDLAQLFLWTRAS